MGFKPRAGIDWASLEHAYGSAADVPHRLEQIAAGRAKAVDALANAVAHQGWASPEVTLPLVPELFDLAGSLGGRIKAAVIALLADLACAGDHRHFIGARVTAANPASEILAAPPMAAIRDAVITRAGSAAGWLDDRSAAVRGAAGLLCAVTGQNLEAVAARLASERTVQARHDLLVALGWLAADGQASRPPALAEALGDGDPRVCVGAALGAAHLGDLDDRTAEALIAALRLEPIAGSAWAGGDVRAHAVEVLRTREGRGDLMARALAEVEPIARARLGAGLVKQTFAAEIASLGSRHPRPTLPRPPLESLTGEQREVLGLLARFDSGWGGGDQRYWLEHLGLPLCPPAMREYFGEPAYPENVCDRVVELGGARGSLWQRLSEVCLEGGVDRAAEAGRALAELSSAAESVELVEVGARVKVPSSQSFAALCLHLLVAHGPAAVPHIRTRLDRFGGDPNPGMHFNYWSYGVRGGHAPRACRRYIPGWVPLLLFAAMRALDRSAPASLIDGRVNRIALEGLLGAADKLGPEAGAWVTGALADVGGR